MPWQWDNGLEPNCNRSDRCFSHKSPLYQTQEMLIAWIGQIAICRRNTFTAIHCTQTLPNWQNWAEIVLTKYAHGHHRHSLGNCAYCTASRKRPYYDCSLDGLVRLQSGRENASRAVTQSQAHSNSAWIASAWRRFRHKSMSTFRVWARNDLCSIVTVPLSWADKMQF